MPEHRRVIRIRAEDSPNVKLGLAQQAKGLEPTGEEVVPGVLSWELYQRRRRLWDPIRQCVGLDGMFYQGDKSYLFPPEWLNLAEERADQLWEVSRTGERTMGVDTAEGGDSTVWCVVDELGILDLVSLKTPDTNIIPGQTIALCNEWDIEPNNVIFDQGGGGSVHVDRLRAAQYKVREVSFGESTAPPPKLGKTTWQQQVEDRREKYSYKNRRAQMYHALRLRLDPNSLDEEPRFAIPAQYKELRRQLTPIPLTYDEEGRVYLLPKDKKPNSNTETLKELIGCSPDEADALVMAIYALDTRYVPLFDDEESLV